MSDGVIIVVLATCLYQYGCIPSSFGELALLLLFPATCNLSTSPLLATGLSI